MSSDLRILFSVSHAKIVSVHLCLSVLCSLASARINIQTPKVARCDGESHNGITAGNRIATTTVSPIQFQITNSIEMHLTTQTEKHSNVHPAET